MREPNGLSRLAARPAGALLLAALSGVACGSHRVLVPPRLNLVPYGSVGLVTFTVEKAKGSLHEVATRRFEEYLLAAQTGIEVQHFAQADTAQALSGARGVPVVFFGHLKVSDVKPSGGLVGLSLPHMEATVTAELSVELRSTKTGGTLWRASGTATEKVGQLAIVGGQPEFSARDPNDAYGRLVNRLVYAVTYDLRSTWVKQ
ncbi:MAG TPA: hypothetical protein VEK86_01725 [Gemmatimonadales bacterium]|nr:hypothetical protein [Gemmatimonadales bacterium]